MAKLPPLALTPFDIKFSDFSHFLPNVHKQNIEQKRPALFTKRRVQWPGKHLLVSLYDAVYHQSSR